MVKKTNIVIAALTLLLFNACVTTSTTTHINHHLTYTAKGTRSEAQHGHLVLNGKELPWVFNKIAHNGVSYSMRYKKHAWGTDGYQRDTTPFEPQVTTQMITKQILKQGYYINNKYLKGTPKNWIFVQWQKSAFVHPTKIYYLIKEHKISQKQKSNQNILHFNRKKPIIRKQ